MAIKKVDKEFCLSDSTVNCYGYRLLTSGYQLPDYQRNPIGYYMHQRDAGVLVRWDDLRVDGDRVLGRPVINMSHPRGDQTVSEINDGFLNAASVGHIVVLEWSSLPQDMLDGQTGPTITKWYNGECSLVDIPGNSNALSLLYDVEGNALQLSDLMSTPNNRRVHMNEIKLTVADLAALQAAGAPVSDAAGLIQLIKDLKLKADEVVTLRASLAKADTDRAALEVRIDTLKAEGLQKQVSDLLDAAEKAGKITAPIKKQLSEVYAGKPDLLKADLDSRGAYQPIGQSLNGSTSAPSGQDTGDYAAYQKLSWDEMHKSNKLPALKSKYPDLYREKYKERYGVYPSAS